MLAAGTGFTDTFIRRGRYPDFSGAIFKPVSGSENGFEIVARLDAEDWEKLVAKFGTE